MRGVLFLLTCCFPAMLYPQEIVINELYNSSAADEWVELVVTADGLDLRGSDLRDFTSSGSPQEPLLFLDHPLWSDLRAGTIILLMKPDAPFAEDLDPSDYLLIVPIDHDSLFSGTLFLFAGSSDAIQVRDSSGLHGFGVSWGASNAGSLPGPRVHFTDASASNTSASYEGEYLTGVTDSSLWTRNNLSPTPAAGNNPSNTAFIEGLRNVASVSPPRAKDERTGLSLQIHPNPFNSISEFGFRISDFGYVSLAVYDLLGRETALLVSEDLDPGVYRSRWDAGGSPSGVYFAVLTSGGLTEIRKVLLIR